MKFRRIGRIVLFQLVIALSLWQCAGTGKSAFSTKNMAVETHNVKIDSTIAANEKLEVLISPYREQMKETMGRIVGHGAIFLKKGKPEGTLNNFVADLMLKVANEMYPKPVEVAITNRGGLRTNIPPGPITLGKIYELMPFENELVVLDMTGLQLIKLANQIGEVGGECIAGMRIEYRNKRMVKMTIQNQKVVSDSVYRVVTTDYLSSPGRRKLSVLGEAPRHFLGIRLRDAILREVEALEAAGKPVTARMDGRLIFH